MASCFQAMDMNGRKISIKDTIHTSNYYAILFEVVDHFRMKQGILLISVSEEIGLVGHA